MLSGSLARFPSPQRMSKGIFYAPRYECWLGMDALLDKVDSSSCTSLPCRLIATIPLRTLAKSNGPSFLLVETQVLLLVYRG
jgi:hypothetical protein